MPSLDKLSSGKKRLTGSWQAACPSPLTARERALPDKALTFPQMADIYQRDHADTKRDPDWYKRCLAPWRRHFGTRPIDQNPDSESHRNHKRLGRCVKIGAQGRN